MKEEKRSNHLVISRNKIESFVKDYFNNLDLPYSHKVV
jgi:hypothetical protein